MFRKTESGIDVYLPLGKVPGIAFTIKDASKIPMMKLRHSILSSVILLYFGWVLYSMYDTHIGLLTAIWMILSVFIAFAYLILGVILNPNNVDLYSRERDGKLQFKIQSAP